MDKIMEFLPFLIPLVIAEFALLGYTLHHILTHKNYKRGKRNGFMGAVLQKCSDGTDCIYIA